MSFREKSAWITLIALLLVTGLYVLHVPSLYEPHPHGWVFLALGISVGLFVLIEIIAHVVFVLRSPREAKAPPDERERHIHLKALRVAYFVFVGGTFLAIFLTLHLARAGAGTLAMAVLLAFVVAEASNCIARIVYYRRSA